MEACPPLPSFPTHSVTQTETRRSLRSYLISCHAATLWFGETCSFKSGDYKITLHRLDEEKYAITYFNIQDTKITNFIWNAFKDTWYML